MEAAFDESIGASSEVFGKPAFGRPGGTDVEGDDFIVLVEVLAPEGIHLGLNVIWDKKFETWVEEVMEAGFDEDVEVRIDLVHLIFKVRNDQIES